MVVAAICGFTYALLHRIGRHNQGRSFLLFAALLTAFLALDDLFMFHEEASPLYLGVPELAVFGVYGILTLVFCICFRRFLVWTHFLLLALALGFFAFSVLVDLGMYAALPQHLRGCEFGYRGRGETPGHYQLTCLFDECV